MAMKKGIFDKLRQQLDQQEWPNVYMFKFIIPNDPQHIAQVNNLFGDEAIINSHPSRNNKFVSISVKELMLDVDSIITIYERSSKISNLIAL